MDIARECMNKYNELEHTTTGFTPEYLLHGVVAHPVKLCFNDYKIIIKDITSELTILTIYNVNNNV